MLKIRKVLNSSVILVENDQGAEHIIVQKGIGYGKKAGEEVHVLDDSKTFVPFSQKEKQPLLELLSKIPAIYLEVTKKIVEIAEKELGRKLNDHIYLALTDHINFAVERNEQNSLIANRVFWELKTFYTKEFKVGLDALCILKEKTGIILPEEEAANIAFHIINAQKEGGNFDSMYAAKLIGQIMTLITYSIGHQPDKESIHYARFISHLQYFAERFVIDKMMESEDDFLYNQVTMAYPTAALYAEKVRTHIIKVYDKCITNEETAYLTIHIQRLISRD